MEISSYMYSKGAAAMKRYIKSATIKQNYFIIWFNEGDDEDYTIIPADSISDAKDQAQRMFGEDTISVEFYKP